jgi:hypothetical protein
LKLWRVALNLYNAIAVFDLDGTLWQENSHFMALNSFYKTNFYTSLFFKLLYTLFPDIMQRYADNKIAKVPYEFISGLTFTFKQEIIDLLQEKILQCDKVLIITNAPKGIAEYASNLFNVTTLTAPIGKKLEVLNRYCSYKNLFVCTDNRNDSDLLGIASEYYYIEHPAGLTFKCLVFFPFYYGLVIRLNGIIYKISFFFTVFIPPLLIVYFEEGLVFSSVIKYIIAFTGMYSVYEIGYILNDTYTAYYENNPTSIYIAGGQLSFLRKKLLLIIAVKMMLVFTCCILADSPDFVISMFFLFIVYLFHNNIRSGFNIFTFFLLNCFKYISVLSIFIPPHIMPPIISLICLLVPVQRTLIYGTKSAFKLYRFKDNDIVLIIYYVFLSVIGILLCLFNLVKVYWLYLFVYFLVIRIAMFVYIKLTNGIDRKKLRLANVD